MFTTVRGGIDPLTPIGPQTVANIVQNYGAVIGRSDLRAHDLRRTFAQHALRDGGDIHQIQMSLRHADLSTTNEYLGHQQDMHRAPCDLLKWQVPALVVCGVLVPGDGDGDGDGENEDKSVQT